MLRKRIKVELGEDDAHRTRVSLIVCERVQRTSNHHLLFLAQKKGTVSILKGGEKSAYL